MPRSSRGLGLLIFIQSTPVRNRHGVPFPRQCMLVVKPTHSLFIRLKLEVHMIRFDLNHHVESDGRHSVLNY